MDCRAKFSRQLWQRAFSVGVLLWLTSSALSKSAPTDSNVGVLHFDAIVELNAPLCRTHVVLFARYWVSPQSYRVAVVWAEPHAGSLNFPIYPPTLNVVSDPNSFTIAHQFQHMYDGVFSRPLGQRGAFRHKFNAYYLSDIRFAEQEALNVRIRAADIQPLKETGRADAERLFDVSLARPSGECKRDLARLSVRATRGRLDELRLLDKEGNLLKSVEYEYTDQNHGSHLHRQNMLLPERPITVGFKGKGPTITIAGRKRQYSQLQTMHHQGGRRCIVDYQPVEIGGRVAPLPARITVYPGDGKRALRSARLYNFTHGQVSTDQTEESAKQFSLFDANETKCHEMLLKYWLKQPVEVNEPDVDTLHELQTDFAGKSVADMTAGEQLKRVNMLLQLDWMLGDRSRLEKDFQHYLSLLAANGLGRMVLFGGQNVIEMTIRWQYFAAADRLLETWRDAAVSGNDVEAALDFAAASLRRGRLWTIAKLMDKILEMPRISPAQRFVAQALRCIALAQVYQMVREPDYIKTELGIAQARWALSRMDAETLRRELTQGMAEARQLFTGLDQPTRQHKALRAQLEKLHLERPKPQDQ
jgi:hypothetical protein